MRIEFIEEDSLINLKTNLSQIVSGFSSDNSSWIHEYFGRSPFLDSKFSVDDFELDMSAEKPFQTEFENVQRVYNHLKFLSASQASDERLWAGLCLGPFWKYTQYRWDVKNNCTVENIRAHYFFGFGPRRSLTRNALSRLWWIGKLTFDDSLEDPYKLTRFVCENQDYIFHILERNTSNSHQVIRPFISALISAKENGININTNKVGELSKYLNLLGGIYILDCLPQKTIYEKILKKALEIQ